MALRAIYFMSIILGDPVYSTCRHFQLHLTLILVLELGGSPGDEMIIITAVLFTIQEPGVGAGGPWPR